jgi:hypothetical protein
LGGGVWIHYRVALALFMGPPGLCGLGLGPWWQGWWRLSAVAS